MVNNKEELILEARRYRLYPTEEQKEQIKFNINANREFWNHLLSKIYEPVSKLDVIKEVSDRERSRKMYDYLNGGFKINNTELSEGNKKKYKFCWGYKTIKQYLKLKTVQEARELIEDKKLANFGKYEIIRQGLALEELNNLKNKGLKITEKSIKEEYPRLKMADSTSLQQTKKFMKQTFKQHMSDPKRVGLPRFKSYTDTLYSGSYTTSNSTAKLVNGKLQINGFSDKKVKGICRGPVETIQHYPVPEGSRIYSVTIIRENTDDYFASIMYQVPHHTKTFSKSGQKIGIDLNISNHGFVSNDGQIWLPPETAKLEQRLNREKRKLNKRQDNAIRGIIEDKADAELDPLKHVRDIREFPNYQKQRIKVAKLQKHMTNMKLEWFRRLASWLSENYDQIVFEDLKVKNMTKKGSGKGAEQKRELNRQIQDSGFRKFRTIIEYKAKWSNKETFAVDPSYTSKTCFRCQRVNNGLTTEREWDCPYCGVHLIRDVNAAQNILARGIKQLENRL